MDIRGGKVLGLGLLLACTAGCAQQRPPSASAIAPATSSTSLHAEGLGAASQVTTASSSFEAQAAAGAATVPAARAGTSRSSADAAAFAGSTLGASGTPRPEPAGLEVEVQRDAFSDFSAETGASDVVQDPRDPTRLYVVEARGTLRVLDASGDAPRLLRAFPLFEAPLGAGRALGRLELLDGLAVLPTWGPGFEGVALFDPRAAASSGDVRWFDLSGLSATWPAGTRDSQGLEVGGRPLPLSHVTGAARAAGALWLCCANTGPEGDHAPGAVVALELGGAALDGAALDGAALDGAALRLGAPRTLLRTSAFSPTGLTRRGDELLVTCTGAFGRTGGAIDRIDARSGERVATIALGAADSAGPVVLNAAGTRGWTGSLAHARAYALDLVAGTAVPSLELPEQGARAATRVALSPSERRLYVGDEGQSALFVLELRGGQPEGAPRRVAGFARSGDPAAYQGLLRGFAVRPGAEEESVFALTSDLAPADRRLPGVELTLDRVAIRR
ncbi:MAG: YncE family protein [Planctomycetota bacterium]